MIGAYHETSEVITGDLPTPIKYFSPEMAQAYKQVEAIAQNRIIATLPSLLSEDIGLLIQPSEDEKRIVKYADKLTAYIKCIEETKVNNTEFDNAKNTIEKELREYNSNSVNYFLDTFIEGYSLTLDELTDNHDNEQ
jgi:5'-deoxynucleotidase